MGLQRATPVITSHLSENENHNHLVSAPARTELLINREIPDQPRENHEIHLSESSHDTQLSENESRELSFPIASKNQSQATAQGGQ